MPCSPRKARILLKKGEAHVVKTNPFFIIQLNKATGEQVQAGSLGIDPGSKHVGFSAINSQIEIVAGELALDQKTPGRLKERIMYRRNRRYRLWYRQPRRNNRANSRKKGSLPPSILRKFNTHITLINKIKGILPIKSLTIEVGNFDIQKIENPDIKGIQYRQGSLFEYQNMRSFLMAREHGKCQLCGKKFSKGNPSHIHHIIKEIKGGTDREKNLALLHEKCHTKLHKKKLFHLLKKNHDYKDAVFMSIIRWKFRDVFPDCHITFGHETFIKRNELRLEKTHFNDAFIIAGGTNQIKKTPVFLGQKHRNNRVLQLNRKGSHRSIRKRRYPIRPRDIVTIDNKKYVTIGCGNYGTWVKCLSKNHMYFSVRDKRVQKVYHTKSIYLAEIL
jgi:hypothetical protein